MKTPNLAGSAALSSLVGAFGGLFTILVSSFDPFVAFGLALAACGFLSRL